MKTTAGALLRAFREPVSIQIKQAYGFGVGLKRPPGELKSVFFLFGLMALAACQSAQDIRRQQYISEGQQLYAQHCSGCHQPGGQGFERLYPPLNRPALWAETKRVEHLCGMRHGIEKPLTLNGITYRQPMPGNTALTGPDLAMLLTYLENTFAGQPRFITASEVEQLMQGCRP